MKETSAKSKIGFLLYDPFTKKYFFRIYDETDKSKFVDYDLRAEEFELEILDNHISLYEKEDKNYLDYSSKVLGKC